MKDKIRKILRESDFDWVNDANVEVPIEEISEWSYETQNKIFPMMRKLKDFYEQAPQVDWTNKEDMEDEDKMIGLSIKQIGDELSNIMSSLESIDDEINYIKNPELFRDDEDDDVDIEYY